MTSAILGIGTAVPAHRVSSARAQQFARAAFSGKVEGLDRLLGVFEHDAMAQRYLARPVDWYDQPRTLRERNEVYCASALELLHTAASRALVQSEIPRDAVGAIVCVSSTGIATPSLDATLVQQLDLPRSIQRLPLWGLGCGGGGAAIARAQALARGLDTHVLVCAVELCSTTFVPGDHSPANLIATSLFGDGAAAVIIGPLGGAQTRIGPGIELLGSHAELFDGTQDLMGWNFDDDGLRVRLGRNIPTFLREHSGAFVAATCSRLGVARGDLRHFVVHPGGPRVLAAYADSLKVDADALADASHILQGHGNMSSPTVLFVLERFLSHTPASDELGILMALAPASRPRRASSDTEGSSVSRRVISSVFDSAGCVALRSLTPGVSRSTWQLSGCMDGARGRADSR